MPPVIDKERCTVCGTCYEYCPQDVFGPIVNDNPPAIVYPMECWHCGACVIDCPEEAIHLVLPLHMQIVPSPALFGPPYVPDKEELIWAAAISRSIIRSED